MTGTLEVEVFCESCNWAGKWSECPYGHNAYVCPKCGKEKIVALPARLRVEYPIYDEKSDEVYKP